MNTDAALYALLNDEDWLLTWLKAGRTKEERRKLRHRLAKGGLSLDLKEALLEQFGFTVKQEKLWRKPDQG